MEEIRDADTSGNGEKLHMKHRATKLRLHLVYNLIDLSIGQVDGGIVLQQGCQQPLHLVPLYHSGVFQVIYVKSNCSAIFIIMYDPYNCQACAHMPRRAYMGTPDDVAGNLSF